MQGFRNSGLTEIKLNDDGLALRLLFEQEGNPFFVEIPTDDLRAMMPIIMKAAAAGPEDAVTAISLAGCAVDLDQGGDVLLTLENTAGAEMVFSVPQEMTLQLSALFDKALQAISGSDQKH